MVNGEKEFIEFPSGIQNLSTMMNLMFFDRWLFHIDRRKNRLK